MWPWVFSRLGEVYAERHGLRYEHLMAIARNNYENAKRNPNAQSRKWDFRPESFIADDAANPVIEADARWLIASSVKGAYGYLAPPTDANSPAIVVGAWMGNSDNTAPPNGTVALESSASLWQAFERCDVSFLHRLDSSATKNRGNGCEPSHSSITRTRPS